MKINGKHSSSLKLMSRRGQSECGGSPSNGETDGYNDEDFWFGDDVLHSRRRWSDLL